nr:adenylate isopentenyltransferase 5, chloroplastic-like [Ipomoea batatas]
MLGGVDPDVEYIAHDFCLNTTATIEQIINFGKILIVFDGSNSFIEALVEDPLSQFKSKYRYCFITGVKAKVMSNIFHLEIDSPKQMVQHTLHLRFNNLVQQNINAPMDLDLVRVVVTPPTWARG